MSGANEATSMLQRFRNKVKDLLPTKKSMLQSAGFLPKISFTLIIAMVVIHLHLASEYAVATNTTNAAGVVGGENWNKFSDLSFDERTYMGNYWVKSDSIESTSGSWVSTEHSEHNNRSQVWVRYSKYCKNNADYCAAIGDWFRPLTATLMHNDYGHLRNEIFGLFMFGLVVENRQSFAAVLLIVWVSAFCCTGIDIYRDDFHSRRTSAGASGVVYGLMASSVADVLMNWREFTSVFNKMKRDHTDTSNTDETSTGIGQGSVDGVGDKAEKLGKPRRNQDIADLKKKNFVKIFVFLCYGFLVFCTTASGLITEESTTIRTLSNGATTNVSSTIIHWGHVGGLLGGAGATLLFGRNSELAKTDFVGKGMTFMSLLAEMLCCIAYTKLSVDLFDKPDSSKLYVWPALPLFWFKVLKEFKVFLDKDSNNLAGNTNPDGPTIEEEEGAEEEGDVEAMI